MQTSEFAELIRCVRLEAGSMQKTADAFNRYYSAAKSKGWYYRIAYRGYDPASLADRDQFRLSPRPCPTCGHLSEAPARDQTLEMSFEQLVIALTWRLDEEMESA